jgi:transposase
MTLCFSRHQYVEFVWDQMVATWLGCHRRAFEWFAAVPARVIYDFVPGNKIVILCPGALCAVPG